MIVMVFYLCDLGENLNVLGLYHNTTIGSICFSFLALKYGLRQVLRQDQQLAYTFQLVDFNAHIFLGDTSIQVVAFQEHRSQNIVKIVLSEKFIK